MGVKDKNVKNDFYQIDSLLLLMIDVVFLVHNERVGPVFISGSTSGVVFDDAVIFVHRWLACLPENRWSGRSHMSPPKFVTKNEIIVNRRPETE